MKSKIYRSSYSPSSSLLKMTLLHEEAFPYTKGTTEEKILVRRLDDAVRSLSLRKNILIKMDAEGYEDKIIMGGTKLISQAKVIIIETSFKPLRLNQPLFGQIYEMLKKLNFEYAGNLGQKKNPVDGNVLLSDSVFINRSL